MIAMDVMNYVTEFGKEPAFGSVDMAVPMVAEMISGYPEGKDILESVNIAKLAFKNLERIDDLEKALRASQGEVSVFAEALITKAKEYPELPGPNSFITKADFLTAATLVAAIDPSWLSEMSTGNMYDETQMKGRGVELLEMGRLMGIVETAQDDDNENKKIEILGEKIVTSVAKILGKEITF